VGALGDRVLWRRLLLRSSPLQLVIVLLIAVVAFALRGGMTTGYFYGLEYEDAFVYAAASRLIASTDSGFSVAGLTVCAVGSAAECSMSESFPGHLPGFPALLYAAQSVVGFHPWLAPTVGALVSSTAVLAVWWAAWSIYRSRLAAAAAALLFAVTPVFALYGGSALSESVSSLPIAVAVGATAAARRSSGVKAWWSWHALVLCAVALAATVRRENAILIGILPAALLAHPVIPLRAGARWVTMFVWAAVVAFAARPVLMSVMSEAGEYGGSSFGFVRFLETVPSLLRALTAPKWFGFVALLAVIGMVTAMLAVRDSRREQDSGLLLVLATATLGAIVLYGAHVRSTYQLMGVPVEPFDFIRYLSNIGVPLCILAPAASASVRRTRVATTLVGQRVGWVVFVSYMFLSAGASWTLREEMVWTEQQVRTEPALAAIDAASALGDHYPIVTLEPLVIQLYGNPNTKTIALPLLTPDIVRAFGGKVLYLRQDHYENDVNRRRYAEGLSALPVTKVVELRKGHSWTVLTMGPSDPTFDLPASVRPK